MEYILELFCLMKVPLKPSELRAILVHGREIGRKEKKTKMPRIGIEPVISG